MSIKLVTDDMEELRNKLAGRLNQNRKYWTIIEGCDINTIGETKP